MIFRWLIRKQNRYRHNLQCFQIISRKCYTYLDFPMFCERSKLCKNLFFCILWQRFTISISKPRKTQTKKTPFKITKVNSLQFYKQLLQNPKFIIKDYQWLLRLKNFMIKRLNWKVTLGFYLKTILNMARTA